MQKYFESVLTDAGPPEIGASVLVTAFGGGAVVIYADNGSTPKANPLTTDSLGYFEFYAPDGRYTLTISGPTITTRIISDVLLEDPQDGNPIVASTLVVTGQSSLGGQANSESLRVLQAPTGAVNYAQVTGVITGSRPTFSAQGTDAAIALGYATKAGAHKFFTDSASSLLQLNIPHIGGVVNYMQLNGASAGNGPVVSVDGSDPNIGITYNSKGNAQHTFNNGNVAVNTVGAGLRVKEGANAKQGTSTLVAGSVVVANTSVTATSRIFPASQQDGGTPGFLRISARVVGTSFTITSSSGTDTSVVAWEIFEPA